MEQADIKQLIVAIEDSEKTQEILDWMKSISSPEFGLIDSLISQFLQNLKNNQNNDQSNQILRALRKLNEWVQDSVLQQMKENKNFPISLRDYIIQTDISNKSGDSYALLGEIFQKENFNSVTNEQFVSALMNDLDKIQDQTTLQQLVYILIHISFDFKHKSNSNQQDPNLVLNIMQKHPNIATISESLTDLINQKSEQNIFECLQFVIDVNSQNLEFFFSQDLKILVEIIHSQIQSCSDENLRIKYIDTLASILKTEQYVQKINQHYKMEILEMCGLIKQQSQNKDVIQKSENIQEILIS